MRYEVIVFVKAVALVTLLSGVMGIVGLMRGDE